MKRYKHKMSHGRNTTFDMGKIVPIGRILASRGETFMHSTSVFQRVSPMANPTMHPVNIFTRHIEVPLDLIWEDYPDFISGGEDNDDTSEPPYRDMTGNPVQAGSLLNHLGYPEGYEGIVNMLWVRAYQLHWNEHVRDDQIQAKVPISLASGLDTTTSLDLQYDNWDKDPFTAARPDDQLGTDVTIPLGSSAPVAIANNTGTADITVIDEATGNAVPLNAAGTLLQNSGASPSDPDKPLIVLLSEATGISLPALAFAIQEGRLQETINIKGNEFKDFLRRYGVRIKDDRIDRPNILATGKTTMQFSEVLATAEGTNTNVGDMAGHGIGFNKSNRYMHYFKLDSVVLTLCCVKPIPMYTQSVDRTLLPMTRYEYYQKEFENIGMQEIPNKLVKHDHSAPDGTYGYEPRYNHLKRIPNTLHGQFVDQDIDWHFGRIFAGDVALNSSMLACVVPERVFLDANQDHIRCMVKHNFQKLSPIKPYQPKILSQL